MRKDSLTIISLAIALISLIIISSVNATDQNQGNQGCPHVIAVIPVGSTETGEPRITKSPANLMIFHTGNKNITNVFLLIVIDEPTYSGLETITINTSISLYKGSFSMVTGDWLGCGSCWYQVSAIRDKLGVKNNNNGAIYYSFVPFLDEITKDPTYFKLEVNSDSVNALVLALGKENSSTECNVCSSFSKSTHVVPEVATLALAAAAFLGAGFHLMRHRKKPHQ